MTGSDQIALVEKALGDLIRDWERYFGGDLRVPPTDAQERIERRLRALAQHPPRQRTDRFRLEQLQHRFAVYSQNWNRMLREREEGRARLSNLADSPPPPVRAPNAADRGSVPSGEGASLYDRYVAAKRAQGEPVGVGRRAFEEQIASQRARLEERLGSGVSFDVMVADGKVKLAARKERAGKKEE